MTFPQDARGNFVLASQTKNAPRDAGQKTGLRLGDAREQIAKSAKG